MTWMRFKKRVRYLSAINLTNCVLRHGDYICSTGKAHSYKSVDEKEIVLHSKVTEFFDS